MFPEIINRSSGVSSSIAVIGGVAVGETVGVSSQSITSSISAADMSLIVSAGPPSGTETEEATEVALVPTDGGGAKEGVLAPIETWSGAGDPKEESGGGDSEEPKPSVLVIEERGELNLSLMMVEEAKYDRY